MSVEFDRREQRRARIRHTCHMCGKPILKGREYIYHTQKYEGQINTFKRHIHCDALVIAALDGPLRGEYEWTDDEITEALREVCYDLHQKGTCEDGDYDECGNTDCYGCYLVQRELIKDPTILKAAERSVKENDD